MSQPISMLTTAVLADPATPQKEGSPECNSQGISPTNISVTSSPSSEDKKITEAAGPILNMDETTPSKLPDTGPGTSPARKKGASRRNIGQIVRVGNDSELIPATRPSPDPVTASSPTVSCTIHPPSHNHFYESCQPDSGFVMSGKSFHTFISNTSAVQRFVTGIASGKEMARATPRGEIIYERMCDGVKTQFRIHTVGNDGYLYPACGPNAVRLSECNLPTLLNLYQSASNGGGTFKDFVFGNILFPK